MIFYFSGTGNSAWVCSIEFEERKSKFIGYVKPIGSKEEAEEFITKIREKHKDATHNCIIRGQCQKMDDITNCF